MSAAALLRKLKRIETPCEKWNCRLQAVCAEQRLACKSFVHFCNTGRKYKPTYLNGYGPSRVRFDRLYRDEE